MNSCGILIFLLLGKPVEEENVQLEQELAEFSSDKDSFVTIGVFDGVHVGHKELITRVNELSKRQKMRSVIITFSQHPQEILNPSSQPPFLTDVWEKAALLRKQGADEVIILTFTKELSELSARRFAGLLQKHLRMKGLVIGPDFAMGKSGAGDIAVLRKLGDELGFSVTAISPVTINGDVVSSTAIRTALAAGDMEKVERFMGRYYCLHGRVIHGKGRGRSLGTPTVNLDIPPGQALPGDGVYATLASIDETNYASVTNVGKDPTFGENERTVETFLLDFENNLYEHEVRIDFVHKIRDEITFDSIDGLRKQIICDISEARVLLSSYPKISS
jgi:riboflavin kinase/FMN adenylyltransferase